MQEVQCTVEVMQGNVICIRESYFLLYPLMGSQLAARVQTSVKGNSSYSSLYVDLEVPMLEDACEDLGKSHFFPQPG